MPAKGFRCALDEETPQIVFSYKLIHCLRVSNASKAGTWHLADILDRNNSSKGF